MATFINEGLVKFAVFFLFVLAGCDLIENNALMQEKETSFLELIIAVTLANYMWIMSMKTTFKPACVVSVYVKDRNSDGTCSGIILHNGHIITSATILVPIAVKYLQLLKSLGSPNFEFGPQHPSIKTEVILERDLQIPNHKNFSQSHYTTSSVNCNSTSGEQLEYIKADIVKLFTCNNFLEAFENLLGGSNWKYITDEAPKTEIVSKKESVGNEEIQRLISTLMPKFLLLKVCDSEILHGTSHDSIVIEDFVNLRDSLEICATPFGNLNPTVFMNSCSRGIVSNAYGKDNCLVLTDARCVPGTEGGPVYHMNDSGRQLIGIVVSSLCWKNNEWIGLSVVCSISEIFSSLSILQSPDGIMSSDIQNTGSNNLSPACQNVVLVKDGNSWGSGIIISRQPVYILTCRHVVKAATNSQVSIKHRPNDEKLVKADIVYSHPDSGQYDIALLEIPSFTFKSKITHFQPAHPLEGAEVFAVGHGIFNSNYNLEPTVTYGTISKVIYFKNSPVMIQTTCAVHPGASGGALVSKDGDFIGIIVSNTKDVDSGASFPHISLCIPISTIWPILNKYLQKGDKSILNNLNITNNYINQLWSLGSVISSKL